jgi:hypothetical protein
MDSKRVSRAGWSAKTCEEAGRGGRVWLDFQVIDYHISI